MLHKKVLFATLLAEGKPWQYLADIDTRAQQLSDTLTDQMMKSKGITEELKERNQIEWIGRMNNIRK